MVDIIITQIQVNLSLFKDFIRWTAIKRQVVIDS